MSDFEKHILKERMKSLDNCNEFQRVFKTRMKPFWENNMLGFDVLAFDKWLDVPEDMSMRTFVLDKYGRDGVKVLEALLLA